MNGKVQQDLEKEFERVDEKYKQGKKLSPEETETFCIIIRQSPIHNIEDYNVCQDCWFKFLYIKSKYGYGYSPNNEPITHEEKERLNRFIDEWKQEIYNERHSETLLKDLSKEKRQEIRELKKKSEYQQNSNLLRNRTKEVIAHSKYIYIMIRMSYPHLFEVEQKFILNGHEIVFDEKPLVHILSRHFSETANLHRLEKTFFSQNISFKEIDIFLRNTVQIINNSGFYVGQNIKKIAFKYKKKTYRVWIEKKTKSYKGLGNIEVNAIGTFYPIEEDKEIHELSINYELKNIDTDYGIYVPK
jgi:hypothetical protein